MRYLNGNHLHFISALMVTLLFSGCYSFKGISIPAGVNTFYVDNFENRAANAPATIDQTFAEALRTKVRTESRLKLVDQDADIIFSGSISSYRITSEAPEEGNTVAFNRLSISVSLKYEDTVNEDNSYEQSFSFFQNFDSTADLQSIQDDLIDEIFVQITELIFNKSFTSW